MDFLLKIKHWQFAIFFLLLTSSGNYVESYFVSGLIVALEFWLFLAWIFSIGHFGNKKNHIPKSEFLFSSCFVLLSVITWSQPFISFTMPASVGNVFAVISTICFLYMICFSSIVFKMVELNQKVLLGDWLPVFFGILIVIFGVWILQPKLNKWIDEDVKYKKGDLI